MSKLKLYILKCKEPFYYHYLYIGVMDNNNDLCHYDEIK